MKRSLKAILIILPLLLVAAFIHQIAIGSADFAPQGFVLSPTDANLGVIEIGTVKTLQTKLVNNTGKDQSFRTVIREIDQSSNGEAVLLPGASDLSYLNWLEFPGSFIVPAQSSKDIVMSFQVNQDAPVGGRAFVVFFQYTSPFDSNTSTSSAIGEIGFVVKLTIDGQLVDFATLELTSAQGVSLISPFDLDVNVVNNGNTLVIPRGVIKLTTVFGLPLDYTSNFNDEKLTLLPGKSRTYELEIDYPSWAILGVYKAEVIAAYGEQNIVLSDAIEIAIIPWYFILVVTFAGLVIVYLVRRFILLK